MGRARLGIALLLAVAVGLAVGWLRRARTVERPRLEAVSGNPLAVDVKTSRTGGIDDPSAPGKSAPVHRGGQVVVHGGWGPSPGQFGRRRDPEANPEAPMSLAAGPRGEVVVLDQVNRRAQRFDRNGKPVGILAFGSDTVQDLALGAGGRTILLDRLVEGNVQIYGADGSTINEVPLAGPGVRERGGVTGVFADAQGIYVESEHRNVVRIADADGQSDPARPELPGRPTRDGRLLVTAARVAPGSDAAIVSAFARASQKPAWRTTVSLGAPILHLVLLDSDAHGNVYVGGEVGHESPEPPFRIVDAQIVIARLGPDGAPRGVIAFPAAPAPEEQFRRLSVDDEGNVYVLVPTDSGVDVVRYSFP